jgi:anti-sigma factor RsiW
MDCEVARTHLLAHRRKTLDDATAVDLDEHLVGCAGCRREDDADAELSRSLTRLPRREAPKSLVRALDARWSGPPPRPRAHLARTVLAVFAGAALAAAAVLVWRGRTHSEAMYTEAVNDHLRVLYSEHPLEVASGGVHQVKPWFSGRVDFAPVVAFGGDDDFPLQGGAVAYFLDRKAAAYEYKRHLHPVTLFVFRGDGLAWPAATRSIGGHARGSLETMRGFHVMLWRDGDLGYALVSDLNEAELGGLAAKIAGP